MGGGQQSLASVTRALRSNAVVAGDVPIAVLEYLSDRDRPWAHAMLRRAYQATDVKAAQRVLLDLARRLDAEYPSAAASVREGLEETLTVLTLTLSPRLRGPFCPAQLSWGVNGLPADDLAPRPRIPADEILGFQQVLALRPKE